MCLLTIFFAIQLRDELAKASSKQQKAEQDRTEAEMKIAEVNPMPCFGISVVAFAAAAAVVIQELCHCCSIVVLLMVHLSIVFF